MENAENSFKIDVIRPVNLLLIQEEMPLRWIRDETARRTGNIENMGFLTDDHDLRDTIMKVRTPKNMISYDGERKTSTCYDVYIAQIKDVYE